MDEVGREFFEFSESVLENAGRRDPTRRTANENTECRATPRRPATEFP